MNKLNTPMKKRVDCKCLFKRNTVPLKILDQCKWPPEKWWYISNVWLQVLLWSKIPPIHLIYAIYGCKCSSKKQRISWGMVGRNYFREILCTEKIFPEITYKEKIFLRKNYSTLDHRLFLWIFTYEFLYSMLLPQYVISAFTNW